MEERWKRNPPPAAAATDAAAELKTDRVILGFNGTGRPWEGDLSEERSQSGRLAAKTKEEAEDEEEEGLRRHGAAAVEEWVWARGNWVGDKRAMAALLRKREEDEAETITRGSRR